MLAGESRLTPPPFTPTHKLPSRSLWIDHTSFALKLYRSAGLWRRTLSVLLPGSKTFKPSVVPSQRMPLASAYKV